MFTEMNHNEALLVNGGDLGRTLQIVGGAIIIVASIAGGIAAGPKSGGTSKFAAATGVLIGVNMIVRAW